MSPRSGRTPWDRIRAQLNGAEPFGAMGENIAKGQRTPAEVMTGWMNSPGHKANILNCGFKNIGVGVAAGAAIIGR